MLFLCANSGSWSAKASLSTQASLINDVRIPPDVNVAKALPVQGASVMPGYRETSEYLIGSVAVGIIFLESNGIIDQSTEDWTFAEESKVISEIQTGLSWWANQNPSAWVSFKYDIHYRVPTGYEPINRPRTQDFLWIQESMTYLGYSSVNYFTQVRDYINALRRALNTNWVFAIFVVDSSNDSNGEFTDGLFAYSYLGGPFLVMTYDNDNWGIGSMDIVTAHEMGHTFYATDEYDGVTEYSGYLDFPDVEGSGCLMDGQEAWSLSSGTWGQVGWRDSDGDGILDIVDTFPNTTLFAYLPDPTKTASLTYTGLVMEVPYPNNNPRPQDTHRDVTINTIANVQYRVDSGAWLDASATDGAFDTSEESFTFTTSPLSSDIHFIETRGINQVGNAETSFATDTVTVVTVPPSTSLSYSSPNYVRPDSTVYVSKNTYITLSTSDNGTDVANTYYRLESGTWTQYTTPFTLSGIPDGLHTLYFYSTGEAGNEETVKSFGFVMDNTAPMISLTSPTNGSASAVSSVNVSWAGLDDGSNIASYEIRIDTGNYVNVGLSTSYVFQALVEGNHEVYIKSVDNLGNSNETSVGFSVDESPPTISVTSPTPSTFLNVTEFTAVWIGSDAVSGIEHYEVKLDDNAWLNAGMETTYTMLGVIEGTHNLTVKAVDKAGNFKEFGVSFFVDLTSPIITITSPTPSYLTNIQNVTVAWNGLDDISGIEHYELRLDEGDWIGTATSTTHDISGLGDGTHNLTAKAIDKAGNFKETSVTFVVDTIPPVLSTVSLKNGSEVKSSDATINWNGLDETSGIDYYRIRLDENSWINPGTSTSYTFDRVSDGNHIVQVEAIDKAGNIGQTRINLVVNTSLIGGPGWMDDAIVFGAVGICALLLAIVFFIKRQKKQSKD